ncbi:MAG: hypothetical protein GX055_06345 [Desulfovibrionales bacterium]|nr:hypothetical protein [Desulfovibrionales bacterium]
MNTDCMQIFLNEISDRYPDDRIVMVFDGAGWHKSNQLKLPQNMKLLFLPPYSPELNPNGINCTCICLYTKSLGFA